MKSTREFSTVISLCFQLIFYHHDDCSLKKSNKIPMLEIRTASLCQIDHKFEIFQV